MSSWFGGPSPSHRDSRSHRGSSPKGYFVRPKSPSRKNSHSHRRDSSPKKVFVRPRSHSPSRRDSEPGIALFLGLDGGRGRGVSPTRSIFSTTSSRGIFGGGGHGGSSYYKRRPRDGFIARLVHRIKRLLRDLYRYARNNPVKLFMLVIMPLVTGGALAKLLGGIGIRLPPGIAKAMGGGGGGGEYDRYGEHHGGGGGSGIDLGQVMSVAKMFM